ncbi:hypothetical protein AB0O91_36295 [Kitasatospora sp. NPDC089797]|uniref:hypothetical protein n=1 Tax=Kitasatospora sp. NPDC089797 TaxID=3155298 RepID=UPI00342B554C
MLTVIGVVVALLTAGVFVAVQLTRDAHERDAETELKRRVDLFVAALNKQSAAGPISLTDARKLAESTGQGELGTVIVRSAGADAVVYFQGNVRYESPPTGWGGVVAGCYQATLPGTDAPAVREISCAPDQFGQ